MILYGQLYNQIVVMLWPYEQYGQTMATISVAVYRVQIADELNADVSVLKRLAALEAQCASQARKENLVAMESCCYGILLL